MTKGKGDLDEQMRRCLVKNAVFWSEILSSDQELQELVGILEVSEWKMIERKIWNKSSSSKKSLRHQSNVPLKRNSQFPSRNLKSYERYEYVQDLFLYFEKKCLLYRKEEN